HLVAAGASLAFAGDEIGEIRLVATLAAVGKFGRIAAEAGLRVFLRDAFHLLRRAGDEGGGRKPALGLEALALVHLQARRALADDDVELTGCGVGHFAAAEIGDVHALLDPLGIVDWLHAVRARGEDVDAAHRLARTIDRADLDFEPPRHVPRKRLAVRR